MAHNDHTPLTSSLRQRLAVSEEQVQSPLHIRQSGVNQGNPLLVAMATQQDHESSSFLIRIRYILYTNTVEVPPTGMNT